MSQSAKNIFKISQTIHWALLAAPTIIGGIVYVFIQNGIAKGDEDLQEFVYIPPIFMLIAIVVGRIIFKKMIDSTEGKSLVQKMQLFLKAHLMRDALYEMAGFITCIAAFATANSIVLLLVPLIGLQFVLTAPTLFKAETELMLSKEEMGQLQG